MLFLKYLAIYFVAMVCVLLFLAFMLEFLLPYDMIECDVATDEEDDPLLQAALQRCWETGNDVLGTRDSDGDITIRDLE